MVTTDSTWLMRRGQLPCGHLVARALAAALLITIALSRVGLTTAAADPHVLCSYLKDNPYVTLQLITVGRFRPQDLIVTPGGFAPSIKRVAWALDEDTLIPFRRVPERNTGDITVIQLGREPLEKTTMAWASESHDYNSGVRTLLFEELEPLFNGPATAYHYMTTYTDLAYGQTEVLEIPRDKDNPSGAWARILSAEKLGENVILDLDTLKASRVPPYDSGKRSTITIQTLLTPIRWGDRPAFDGPSNHYSHDVCRQ